MFWDLEILQRKPHYRDCRAVDLAIHLEADGSDIIRTPIDPSCPLFRLKFEPSFAEMDSQIGGPVGFPVCSQS